MESKVCLRINGEKSEWFKVDCGMRYGFVVSMVFYFVYG